MAEEDKNIADSFTFVETLFDGQDNLICWDALCGGGGVGGPLVVVHINLKLFKVQCICPPTSWAYIAKQPGIIKVQPEYEHIDKLFIWFC